MTGKELAYVLNKFLKSPVAQWARVQIELPNGEKLNEKPRIELSTIHAAKGGEATNVVLLTDLTENTMRSYEKNPDDENRLFYVGATRTKENLHIIEPKKYNKGFII